MAPSRRRVISQLQTRTHPFLSNMRTEVQSEPALMRQASLFFVTEVSLLSLCRRDIYSTTKQEIGLDYQDVFHLSTLHVSSFWSSNMCVSPAGPLQADQKHSTRSGMIPCSWQHRMKLQLFLKASKAYYVLSDAATNLLKYGRALRYIKLSLQCYGKVI